MLSKNMGGQMPRFIICFMMLYIGICLYADGADKPQATSYSKAQMDKLAEKYKAASGFTGTIRYDLNQGSFTKIEGKLPNISVSDTTSAKAVALKLLSSLKSYMKINPAQLGKWEVKPENQLSYSYYVIGYQRINGLEFEFENQRGVLFGFSKNTPGFVEVSTTFVPGLSFSTKNLISEAKAKEIYRSQPGKSEAYIFGYTLKICPISKTGCEIPYTYRPCWLLWIYGSHSDNRKCYIDAETGEILMNTVERSKFSTSDIVTEDTNFADGTDKPKSTHYSKAQMDSLAEQCKTALGFVGKIGYDMDKSSLNYFEGKFANLTPRDTLSARNAAKTLLSSLQPYMKTNPAQLTDWRVFPDNGFTDYIVQVYQHINGLDFENQERITFTFLKYAPGEVHISSTYVSGLDFPPVKYITKKKAIEVIESIPGLDVLGYYDPELKIYPIYRKDTNVIETYAPCWKLGASHNDYEYLIYYVDAETGTILMKRKPQIDH